MLPLDDLSRAVCRRAFLHGSGLSLGALALRALLHADAARAASPADPLAAKEPPLPARAKRVIHIHLIGAPSNLDLFDFKPALLKYDGKVCPESLLKGKRFAFIGTAPTLAASRYRFNRHGRGGQFFSELLPHMAREADRFTFVRSMRTDEINHAPAQMFLHTGFGRGGRPSLGSWVTYGLGTINQELPAYVVLCSGPTAGAGNNLWSAGFLPSIYQGVQLRTGGDPVLYLSNPRGTRAADRRRVLDVLRKLNEEHLAETGDPEIQTRIGQYEMAFRMQSSVPELADLTKEPRSVLDRYGVRPGVPSFAANCLLARRLIERGVRMVQLFDADWDHHANLAGRLPTKCRDVDRPTAALVADLAERGLLDDTLVIWGGEFGRTPLLQSLGEDGPVTKPGRDHHKDAFTLLLAGGGIKRGINHGKTDELGFDVVEDPVHVHDLNATILHLLGFDHERLTFPYQGRDFRLTDVHGKVVRGLLA